MIRASEGPSVAQPWLQGTVRAGGYDRALDDSGDLDCLTCGACCRTGQDGRILVPAEDLVRWRRIGRGDLADAVVPGHFGEMAFPTTKDGACVHLGDGERAHACRIYDVRGTTCREFERGSPQCREFRRDFAIDPPIERA